MRVLEIPDAGAERHHFVEKALVETRALGWKNCIPASE